MPRPQMNVKQEKSKDFKGSIKKIIISLKPWHRAIIISITLAMISSIISLIAPNKLSDLTDYIREGITPRVSEKTIQDIMQDNTISIEDKQIMMNLINSVDDKSNKEELLKAMDNLPDSIYNKIKPIMNMQKIKNISLLLAILYIISALYAAI